MLHATSLKSPRHRVHRNGRLRQRVWLSSSGLAPRLSSPVHAVLRQIRRAKHLQRCICAEGFWVDNRLTPPVMAVMDRPTSVSYTHLRAHETVLDLVCRLL